MIELNIAPFEQLFTVLLLMTHVNFFLLQIIIFNYFCYYNTKAQYKNYLLQCIDIVYRCSKVQIEISTNMSKSFFFF